MRPGRLVLVPALALLAACGATPHAQRAEESPPTPSVSAGGRTVLGLGDSVMRGTHCGCAGILARYAEREGSPGRRPIASVNLGVDAATTSTLVTELEQPAVARLVGRSLVVVVIIGANDLVPLLRRWQGSGCPRSCYQPEVDAMGRRLDGVLATVKQLRGQRAGAILVLDYWNVLPDGDQTRDAQGAGMITWARRLSRVANATICSRSAAYGDRCVDLYGPMLAGDGNPTDLLAADGDHPNSKGVDLIVSRLVAATPRGVFGG